MKATWTNLFYRSIAVVILFSCVFSDQPTDYVVVMKKGFTANDLVNLIPEKDGEIVQTFDVNGQVVALVRITIPDTVKTLQDNPEITYIEPNKNYRLVKPVASTLHGLQSQTKANEFVVALKSRSREDALKSVEVIHRTKLNGKTIALVRADSEQLQYLRSHARVNYVEKNHIWSKPTPIIGTGSFPRLYNVRSRNKRSTTIGKCTEQYGTEQQIWGLIRTSYHDMPDYNSEPYVYDRTGGSVTIYVVDTGVDITHPEFGGRAQYGMVSSELAAEGDHDLNGHGTNVASLAAGVTFGVAKNASIVACKVLGANGTGSTFGIAQGVAWVVNQVRSQRQAGEEGKAVINMSLGGSGKSMLMEEAIAAAVQEGVVVVVAAGNDAVDASQSVPGAYNMTVTVGAVGPGDEFASFSNYGAAVDISAAGVVCLGAYSTYLPSCSGKAASECQVYMSGTSQATPHVSGVVALWLDSMKNPDVQTTSPHQVKAMLQETATTGTMTFSNNKQSNTYNGILYRSSDCSLNDDYSDLPNVASGRYNSIFSGFSTYCSVITYILYVICN